MMDRDTRAKLSLAAKAIIAGQQGNKITTMDLSNILARQFPEIGHGDVIRALISLAKSDLAEWHERGAAIIIKRYGSEQRRRPYVWRQPKGAAQQNCAQPKALTHCPNCGHDLSYFTRKE